jgi:hypothetical protein
LLCKGIDSFECGLIACAATKRQENQGKINSVMVNPQVIEGKPSFSPKEMDGWFTMCGFQKPSQMPMALFDTKRKSGYAESVSRGSWRVSNQGENLIIRKIEERHGG